MMDPTTPAGWVEAATGLLLSAGYGEGEARAEAERLNALRANAKPLGKPARNWCACGRPFYNRAGMIHHGNSCPVEQRRSAAFVAAIQAGRRLDESAQVRLPAWDRVVAR
jgi:hypothetical protein